MMCILCRRSGGDGSGSGRGMAGVSKEDAEMMAIQGHETRVLYTL